MPSSEEFILMRRATIGGAMVEGMYSVLRMPPIDTCRADVRLTSDG